jgi:hypothetical protein
MNTTRKLKKNARAGTAIITVLGLVALISMASGYMAYTASQEMQMSRVLRESLKAKLIAESGLNTAYQLLKTDFSRASGLRLEGQFGSGTYVVTSIPDATNTKRYQLISNGTCGTLGKFKVAADVENRAIVGAGSGGGSNYYPLNFDILSGGSIDLSGNFKALVDQIFANGNILINKGSNIDTLLIGSAGTVTFKSFTGTSTVQNNQPAVNIRPAELIAAIQALKDYAISKGQVYSSGSQIPAAPDGGIAYCTGDASTWSGSGTGCFIFEGDLPLQGGGAQNITSVDGYPALIVLGTGQVKINSTTVIQGAILIPNGSAWLNGGAQIYGPILVGQSINGNGTADLYSGAQQGFNLPPVTTTTDNVIITAWH